MRTCDCFGYVTKMNSLALCPPHPQILTYTNVLISADLNAITSSTGDLELRPSSHKLVLAVECPHGVTGAAWDGTP